MGKIEAGNVRALIVGIGRVWGCAIKNNENELKRNCIANSSGFYSGVGR